ncbi:glucans biosynthesis protein [Ruminiclostridium hungatei]|uniref:Glucans biosynthesis protein n=1 Tax=Ruminiclostridium hungatei TaxID=48256 RepID=A0A1V4SF73_RUMHU|nr:acyltransferase family protein [Ruminiclostridium hungatei]OPX41917.1 glucans biosynthesis protein [Ruminiclostridium hungatei]
MFKGVEIVNAAVASEKRVYHYLNNIKVFLAFLIVACHANMAYGGAGGWYYVEVTNDELSTSLLTMANAIIQSFSMALFFFLAAYFSPGSYDKRSFSRYFKDRTSRLVLPGLFYCLVLNPLCINLVRKQDYFSSLGFYNLWFVMALFFFSVAYALLRRFIPIKVPAIGNPKSRHIFALIIFIGILNFITRIFFKTDKMYIFDFTFGYFPQYIVFFILGVIAFRNNWLDSLNKNLARRHLSISIASIVLFPAVFLIAASGTGSLENFFGGVTFESMFYSMWEPLLSVGIILGILSGFRNKLNFTIPVLSKLARCSYSIYIIQGPIIVILQIALRAININILAKASIVTVLTFGTTFAISLLILKIPRLDKIL